MGTEGVNVLEIPLKIARRGRGVGGVSWPGLVLLGRKASGRYLSAETRLRRSSDWQQPGMESMQLQSHAWRWHSGQDLEFESH